MSPGNEAALDQCLHSIIGMLPHIMVIGMLQLIMRSMPVQVVFTIQRIEKRCAAGLPKQPVLT